MTHYLGLHVWRKIAKGITDQGNRGPRQEVPKIIDQPDDIADEDADCDDIDGMRSMLMLISMMVGSRRMLQGETRTTVCFNSTLLKRRILQSPVYDLDENRDCGQR